jgi:adenosylcobinamide kinase/adenosylcobinamide-phosphate guanylyltransferase
MKAKRVILIGGGARSGKSELALRFGRRLGVRRAFIATAQAGDAEMRDRITQHRRERGPEFETYEEPLRVPELLGRLKGVDVVVLDCLTLWLSNLLCRGDGVTDIHEQVNALAELLEQRAFQAVIVTNEVGMGIVPDNALGRSFRDLTGAAHQRLGRVADEIYFGALGTMLRIRPAMVGQIHGELDDTTEDHW